MDWRHSSEGLHVFAFIQIMLLCLLLGLDYPLHDDLASCPIYSITM